MTTKTAFTGTLKLQQKKLGMMIPANEGKKEKFVAAQEGDMISFYKNSGDITPVMTVEAKRFENSKDLVFIDIAALNKSYNSIGARSGAAMASLSATHEAKMLRAELAL